MRILLVLVSAILVETINCLDCYSCTNITDVKQCTTLATCQDSESCFLKKSGVTLEMGCQNKTACLMNMYTIDGVFGKRQVSHCNECCSTDHCNSGLCDGSRGTTAYPGSVAITSGTSYKVQGGKSPVKGTCFFNNQTFNLGDHWQDTCRYDCRCVDTEPNTAECNDVCPHYSSLPPSCTIRQKTDECCPKLDCGNETSVIHHPGPVNTTTFVNGSCKDEIPGCDYYEDVVCRGIYEPWARAHCALRCGYCGYPAPCVDTITNCVDYELETACHGYPGWARVNCKKSCSICE